MPVSKRCDCEWCPSCQRSRYRRQPDYTVSLQHITTSSAVPPAHPPARHTHCCCCCCHLAPAQYNAHILTITTGQPALISQRRSRTKVLCTRCVRCNVSSDRIALFTFCVLHYDSVKCHIFGDCTPQWGAMTPKFELGRDFCAVHLPPSFIILCLLIRKLSC